MAALLINSPQEDGILPNLPQESGILPHPPLIASPRYSVNRYREADAIVREETNRK